METKCGAETEGKATQRLSYLGIHPINSHQTLKLLWMTRSAYRKEPVMVVFWRGPARALQIQRQMLGARHWTECGVPNGGVAEQTGGAERICSPIGRTTMSSNQMQLNFLQSGYLAQLGDNAKQRNRSILRKENSKGKWVVLNLMGLATCIIRLCRTIQMLFQKTQSGRCPQGGQHLLPRESFFSWKRCYLALCRHFLVALGVFLLLC